MASTSIQQLAVSRRQLWVAPNACLHLLSRQWWSSKYTKQTSGVNPLMTTSTSLWKVAGAPVKLNSMMQNLKVPSLVTNVVLSRLSIHQHMMVPTSKIESGEPLSTVHCVKTSIYSRQRLGILYMVDFCSAPLIRLHGWLLLHIIRCL